MRKRNVTVTPDDLAVSFLFCFLVLFAPRESARPNVRKFKSGWQLEYFIYCTVLYCTASVPLRMGLYCIGLYLALSTPSACSFLYFLFLFVSCRFDSSFSREERKKERKKQEWRSLWCFGRTWRDGSVLLYATLCYAWGWSLLRGSFSPRSFSPSCLSCWSFLLLMLYPEIASCLTLLPFSTHGHFSISNLIPILFQLPHFPLLSPFPHFRHTATPPSLNLENHENHNAKTPPRSILLSSPSLSPYIIHNDFFCYGKRERGKGTVNVSHFTSSPKKKEVGGGENYKGGDGFRCGVIL